MFLLVRLIGARLIVGRCGNRSGVLWAVPPAAAERHEQRGGVGITAGLGLHERDARGVHRLTLNSPSSFNALSEATTM